VQPRQAAEYASQISRRYLALGQGEAAVREAQRAISFAREALADGEADPDGYKALAKAYELQAIIDSEMGNAEGAIKNLTAAIESSPHAAQRATFWASMADIHDGSGNASDAQTARLQAIDEYRAALPYLRADGTRAAFWSRVATLHEELGQVKRAIEALEAALALLPSDSEERARYEERLRVLKGGNQGKRRRERC
jgi:tetratricopeptide (TPR) repeat protein